jgi:type IV secretion system protein VirB6
LTALFAAAGAIEVKFATASVPAGSLTDIPTTAKLAMMGITFIVVSLNLPALASALAGGVGISAMAQHAGGPARFAGKSVGKGINSGYQAAKQLTGRAAGGSIEG